MPAPVGEVLSTPALSAGIGMVVVVLVVWVTVTAPSVWSGDPVHPTNPVVASRSAIGRRLRTDIVTCNGYLKGQIDAGQRRDARMKTVILQRDERAQRQQHL